MKITTSYTARLKPTPWQSHLLQITIQHAQCALEDIIRTLEPHWDDLKTLKKLARKTAAERYYHATKENPAPENTEWDAKYPYMPCDMRRALNTRALGILSSWASNTKNWNENGQPGRAPQLQYKHNLASELALYNSNVFKWAEKSGIYTSTVKIKVWNGKNWHYEHIAVKPSDLAYFKAHKKNLKPSAPSLERKGKTWALRFAYTEQVELVDNTDPRNTRILAVDQGVTTAATCVVMESDGTILARKSIKYKKETRPSALPDQHSQKAATGWCSSYAEDLG